MIRCVCPSCNTKYGLEDRLAGRKLRCRVCNKTFLCAAAAKAAAPVDDSPRTRRASVQRQLVVRASRLLGQPGRPHHKPPKLLLDAR